MSNTIDSFADLKKLMAASAVNQVVEKVQPVAKKQPTVYCTKLQSETEVEIIKPEVKAEPEVSPVIETPVVIETPAVEVPVVEEPKVEEAVKVASTIPEPRMLLNDPNSTATVDINGVITLIRTGREATIDNRGAYQGKLVSYLVGMTFVDQPLEIFKDTKYYQQVLICKMRTVAMVSGKMKAYFDTENKDRVAAWYDSIGHIWWSDRRKLEVASVSAIIRAGNNDFTYKAWNDMQTRICEDAYYTFYLPVEQELGAEAMLRGEVSPKEDVADVVLTTKTEDTPVAEVKEDKSVVSSENDNPQGIVPADVAKLVDTTAANLLQPLFQDEKYDLDTFVALIDELDRRTIHANDAGLYAVYFEIIRLYLDKLATEVGGTNAVALQQIGKFISDPRLVKALVWLDTIENKH